MAMKAMIIFSSLLMAEAGSEGFLSKSENATGVQSNKSAIAPPSLMHSHFTSVSTAAKAVITSPPSPLAAASSSTSLPWNNAEVCNLNQHPPGMGGWPGSWCLPKTAGANFPPGPFQPLQWQCCGGATCGTELVKIPDGSNSWKCSCAPTQRVVNLADGSSKCEDIPTTTTPQPKYKCGADGCDISENGGVSFQECSSICFPTLFICVDGQCVQARTGQKGAVTKHKCEQLCGSTIFL